MVQSQKWAQRFAALTVAVFAASCSNHEINKLSKEPRDETEFHNTLANEYEALAKKESNIYNDHLDAKHFAVKGLQAAAGMHVMPEDPKRWDIHKNDLGLVNDLRHRLVFALERGGRLVSPQKAAQAQVAYDCFVEELEEGRAGKHQKAELNVCKKLAMDRINGLEDDVFKHGPVRRIYFAYNSHKLDHDAMVTIHAVADRLLKHGDDVRLMIVGRTDLVGKVRNNNVLSHNRAMMVKKALLNAGVHKHDIAMTVGRGELETSNRSLEPNNRVVDIYMMRR